MTIIDLIWCTIAVLAVAMWIAYRRTRDPLHPLMYIGPMLMYIYGATPAVFYYRGNLFSDLPEGPPLFAAYAYTLFAISLFCLGCLRPRMPRGTVRLMRVPMKLSPLVRQRLARVSYVLAGIGLAVFYYRLALRGGIVAAYSGPKGGVARLGSGYLQVAPLLTIPAIMFYFLSRQGLRMTWKMIALMLLLASPQLIQGALGGSRGPSFLAFGTLMFGWYLATAKRPSLRLMLAALLAIGMLLMTLKFYRQHVYIGSEKDVPQASLQEILLPTGESKGLVTSYSLGLIMATRYHGNYFWGKGFLVQLLVRPIPRQLWPTKYEDVGMGWMVTAPGSSGMSQSQWREAIGWSPNTGSAAGFIADSFVQFAWGGLVVCYLIGFLYGLLWRNSILFKGLWSLIYFEAAVVSVYLPTQGLISAWGFRFLYLAVPSIILWHMMIRRWLKEYPASSFGRILQPEPIPPKITP